MDRLPTPPAEVARTLLVVRRRGRLSAAEAITGHTSETSGRWLRLAADHAQALTQALVHDRPLSQGEVDAFWSFGKKSVRTRAQGRARRVRWAHAGGV